MNADENERAQYRRDVWVGTFLLGFPFLLVGTWITLLHLPVRAVCSVQDNWFLRMLWPFNAVTYEELKSLPFSQFDKCTILAGRSIFSAYFAAATVLASLRFFRVTWKADPKKAFPLQSVGLLTLVGFGNAFLGRHFDDHYHGRGAAFAYRTYDSPGLLVAKSLVFIVFIYLAIFCWAAFAARVIRLQNAMALQTADDKPLYEINVQWDKGAGHNTEGTPDR